MSEPSATTRISSTESIVTMIYFIVYIGYLFARPENELLHWLSLVILPLGLLFMIRRSRSGSSLRGLLESIGLRRRNLRGGILIALVIGTILTLLQFVISRYGPEMLEMVRSGQFFVMYPVAFVAMLLMAATTEEVFFRGILQTRIAALLGSRIGGVVVASLAFGLSHLPYAYLNSGWPSHGDWSAAFAAAFGQAVPGGLILGGLFEGSRRNLLACILLHAMINAAPATTMIHFGS